RTSEVQKQNDEITRQREIEKVRNWITEGLALFGDIISKHKGSLEELAHNILTSLVRYVNAHQGTMAVAVKDDPTDEHLKIVSTFGVNRERLSSGRIEIGSGLIGATYIDKEKKYLQNIPANYIKIESGLGTTTPAKLIILPLKTEDGEVHGVIELAFLKEVDSPTQEFLDKVSGVIALNIHAANLNHKTMILLQQSKEQTEELQSQEEEMRQNMEELEATQEELRRREQEYQQRIAELEKELGKSSIDKK
ncbi:MAG TPA: GAF domain-containing protein, partial [Cyclobacteriaceae bacterium]|nr:GAF domain-containing protein [Cyclobacteriaceae bacterium]